jgi:hypothetical protein
MPLLEIIQTRQISASIRLDEATATQVDQYAAFIHATADDVVDKALNYVFSKDRDFQEFLKTSLAAQVAPSLRIRKPLLRILPNLLRRRQPAGWGWWSPCVDRKRDYLRSLARDRTVLRTGRNMTLHP